MLNALRAFLPGFRAAAGNYRVAVTLSHSRDGSLRTFASHTKVAELCDVLASPDDQDLTLELEGDDGETFQLALGIAPPAPAPELVP